MPELKASLELLREGGGIFEAFDRFFLAVRGPDRVSFLNKLLTADIQHGDQKQSRLACLLSQEGKILFSTLVHLLPDEILLEMELVFAERAQEQLNRYRISEAVEITPVEERYQILPFHGPRIPELLRNAWPDWKLPEAPLERAPGPEGSGIFWALRWDLFGMPGIHLALEPAQETPLRERLITAGASAKIQRSNPISFEILRVEAGIPWPGKEITEDTLPNELGNDGSRFVNYQKGCFVGQERIAHIKNRAHPPRLLTGMAIQERFVPPVPCPISAGKTQVVGELTSCYFSPSRDQVIGLGFLRFGAGTLALQIDGPNGPLPITPISLSR